VFAKRARDLFGPAWTLERISFAHAPLGPRATYDRICQAPIRFEAPYTEVVFARDLLALPMPGADPHLNAILAAEADATLAAIRPAARPASFIEAVNRKLNDGLADRDLTLTALADHFGMSARTLQRRLRAAGVTHRALVRGIRQERATRSLATGVSQRHIARALGYSGPAAFQRAFRRWAGMTPAQRRRRSKGSGPGSPS
jgi:AraC-like DNA-binding protein